MTKLSLLLTTIMAGAMAAATPLAAHPPRAPEMTEAERISAYEADRATILAMAGDYRVRFDMRETTSWREDYAPIEPSTSGGHEIVRAIEDTGGFISLQHILVVEHEGQRFVVKHWRQDWTYEPESVLVYAGPDEWRLEEVPEAMRPGLWSQTVWQVDDSPRYGSHGRWTDEGGVRRWRSNWTWRPLARRDAIRDPRYDRYMAINRHSPSPTGWIHWQDNIKMGMVEGELAPFVQESVLNTYTRDDGFDAAFGEAYWEKTADYWAAVRAEWDRVIAANGGVRIEEEAQTGSVISARLLEIADEIVEGERETAWAIAEARTAMRGATSAPALASR